MNLNINNLNINYIQKGNGKNVILIHGWGQDINYFNSLINQLSKNYSVYALDLPGFGASDIPDEIYDMSKYSYILEEFIKELKIKSPTLLGHSFGGKVILDLVCRRNYHPNKIILVDSSGIKQAKSIKAYYKIYSYKIIKFFIGIIYKNKKDKLYNILNILRKKYGSSDYLHTVGYMRQTFINVVNESYNSELNKIKTPTLLLWGDKDKETPLKNAHYLNKRIKDSGLVIIKGANHFPFVTNFNQFLIIIKNFLSN